MSLTDPTGGAGYASENRLPRGDVSTLTRNLGRMVDNRMGTALSGDTDYSIDPDDGTTYIVTGDPTATRTITLNYGEGSGVLTASRLIYEQLTFRFDCDTSTATWRIRDLASNTIATCPAAASMRESVIVFWDGTIWRPLQWTLGITV